MRNPIRRAGGVAAGIAAIATSASAQTAELLNARPIGRVNIEHYPRVDDDAIFVEPVDASGGSGDWLCWHNGEPDDLSAHQSQVTDIGTFLTADDFFIKDGTYKSVHYIDVCMLVSDTVDGQMVKPDVGLRLYDDCDGRPFSQVFAQLDPEKITATLDGASTVAGFNKWTFRFEVNLFLPGYARYWIIPFGVADIQDAKYFWCSANSGVIQGAQGQIKNHAEPWMDVAQCDCPGVCTDFCFDIYGHVCCLDKNNTPYDTTGGARSLQLLGATIDTARAVDNFQFPPTGQREVCRIEAWVATNCPTDKFFLEIYTNDCNMPSSKLCTIDLTADADGDGIQDYPIAEPTGDTYLGCDIYKLTWEHISPTLILDGGGDFWLSVVGRGTGNVFDKAYWMYVQDLDCNINITEGKVKNPMIEGLEDFTFVSDATSGDPRDFAFRFYTTAPPCLGREDDSQTAEPEPEPTTPSMTVQPKKNLSGLLAR